MYNEKAEYWTLYSEVNFESFSFSGDSRKV